MPTWSQSPRGARVLLSLAFALLLPAATSAQPLAVSGRVVDSNGLPIGGASILAVGAGRAETSRDAVIVRTDRNGRFEIPAATTAVDIIVSAPGYRTATVWRRSEAFGTIVLAQREEQTTSFSRAELGAWPTARDPWALVTLTPNVTMADGVNVGGASSGQQLSPASRAAGKAAVDWRIGGVSASDLRAVGASPAYFDFGAIESISVTTAALPVWFGTAGPAITVRPISGTNRFHSDARAWFTPRAVQSSNVSEAQFAENAGPGVPLQGYLEGGVQAGGPVARGRLWFWGAYAATRITRSSLNFYRPDTDCAGRVRAYDALDGLADCLYPDRTDLEWYEGRARVAVTPAHTLQIWVGAHDKRRNTRDASELTTPEATYRQHGRSPRTGGSHTWTSAARWAGETRAQYDGAHFLLDFQRPELADVQVARELTTQVYSRSAHYATDNKRPSTTVESVVRGQLSTWADLTVGGGYRRDENSEYTHTGGGAVLDFRDGQPQSVRVYRDELAFTRTESVFSYMQLGARTSHVSARLGVRLDHRDDQAPPASVPASPLMPTELPAATFAGADPPVDFTDLAPRASVSVDVSGTGRTVLTASGGRYFGQDVGLSLLESLTATTASRSFAWFDANHDGIFQPNETGSLSTGTFLDPATGLPVGPGPDRLDPHLKNVRTTEGVVSIDQQLPVDWRASGTFIWRRTDRFRLDTIVGLAPDQLFARTFTDPVTQQSATYYEAARFTPTGDAYTTNATGRTADYRGFELHIAGRVAPGWHLRGSLALESSTAHYPAGSFRDPTNIAALDGRTDDVALPRYTSHVMIDGRLPWGIDMGAVASVRDGFARDIQLRGPTQRWGINSGVYTDLFTEPRGTSRYPRVALVDLQAGKTLRLRARARLELTAVMFNAFNANTVLSRSSLVNLPTYNQITGMLGPRVMRFGATLRF
jgi:hypothetical protein